ncbi:hypothetical protein PMAYCL1PPCAC_10596, partial [Pristionchus mayeri]
KRSVFITGCNRGIGLGLVKEFLNNHNVSVVIAGTRNLANAGDLLSLGDDPRLHFVEIDVQKEETIKTAFTKIKAENLLGESGLDVLINNAGICFPLNVDAPIDREGVRVNWDVNCTGTIAVTQNFKPLLLKAAARKGSAYVINMSSIMASMTNTFGPMGERHMTGYSMSKAALNMLTRCLSMGWKDEHIGVTSISPGWVQTEMGGEGAEISVEESAEGLVRFAMIMTEEHSGKYYNYDGTEIEW